MRNSLAVAFILISQYVFAQNCFENCRDHLAQPLQAGEDIQKRLERSEKVLQQLVGCKAPSYVVTSIEGELLNSAELRGKVIVLNFWFQSCSVCVNEIRLLNQLVKNYEGTDDIVFIAFSRDSELNLNRFLSTTSFDFQIVSNQYDITDAFCVIGGWPMHMVIDKKGIVQFVEAGGFTKEQEAENIYDKLKTVIEQTLSKK